MSHHDAHSPLPLAIDELTDQFDARTLDPHGFGHREHMQVAWTLVRRHGVLEAVSRFDSALREITETIGIPEKYHATVTYALVFLIGERLETQGESTWDEFEAANGDLLAWPNPILEAMYGSDLMTSPEARSYFVMPKRASV